MPDKLASVFEKAQSISEIREMLIKPHAVIQGSFKLLGSEATKVWRDVSENGRVYRWDTAQGPQIHILPTYIAQKLLEGTDFPYEREHFYYDKKMKQAMMAGELARGIHRRDGVVAVMIRTDSAYHLLEKFEARMKAIDATLQAISALKPGSRVTIEVGKDGALKFSSGLEI